MLTVLIGKSRSWRKPIALSVGLLVVAIALVLPSPRQPAPPNNPAAAGPLRLADIWPASKELTVASTLKDGTAFQPLLVIDKAAVVGIATSPDLVTSRLVIRASDGALRTLRTLQGQQGSSVVAIVEDGDQLFWLETSDDVDQARVTTLWRAGKAGGEATSVATDDGDLLYYNSAYDLLVVGGKAIWAVAGAQGGGEIHSVPIGGGPVQVRKLDRLYALSAWPWATSSGGSKAGDVELLNLLDGQRHTVRAGPTEILTCTPVWCRVTTLVNLGKSITFEVEHPDGTGRRKTGTASMTPVNTDVALLDRFEVVSATVSSSAAGYTQQLWLVDLSSGKTALISDTVTATVGSRGAFLWWSTGDNETVTWHLLDLRQLS